jgi:hypothetical protein
VVGAVATALIGSPAAVDAPWNVAHFSLAAGQQPENLLVEPDGSVDLTFSFSRVLAHLDRQGRLTTIATLPAPPDGTVVPQIGSAFVGGIVRTADGTLYVTYAAGDADLTGIWRIRPGGEPQRITAMPADGVPNGLVLADGYLYTTDSARATVLKSPISGGNPTAWITDPALAAGEFYRDWDSIARSSVAALRAVGDLEDDPAFIGELVARSQEFSRLWARHDVRGKTQEAKRLRHPDVGDIDVTYQSFSVNGSAGQQLVVYQAESGSPSAERIALPGSLCITPTEAGLRQNRRPAEDQLQ